MQIRVFRSTPNVIYRLEFQHHCIATARCNIAANTVYRDHVTNRIRSIQNKIFWEAMCEIRVENRFGHFLELDSCSNSKNPQCTVGMEITSRFQLLFSFTESRHSH